MTKKQRVKMMLQAEPKFVNNDMEFMLYIMDRYLAKHNAPKLTKEQRLAFADMGNPDHYLREARDLRAKDNDIKKLITKESMQARQHHEQMYRRNFSPIKDNSNHAVSWL